MACGETHFSTTRSWRLRQPLDLCLSCSSNFWLCLGAAGGCIAPALRARHLWLTKDSKARPLAGTLARLACGSEAPDRLRPIAGRFCLRAQPVGRL